MACNHEFIATDQVGVGYCRCKLCLKTFPVAYWIEQISQKVDNFSRILGMADRKVDRLVESENSKEELALDLAHQIKRDLDDFKKKVEGFIFEEVEEPAPEPEPKPAQPKTAKKKRGRSKKKV